ncbi:hypothetical protein SAMN02982929_01572 [Saccharopolyspora kobensis]|uniref:Uncharacterized protein n=1 Tax=Saccharopolyspora kobensis TaxID=146035 RepID=A0A1H5XMF0_9PSEU|nr:hypothetical protein [Saccharopolyspora kobensis]SEG12813.1 hypothetical protein SAMN02982929_01572 [Saccharopolyspora kobensis]SFE40713.1 hypothetical protein SAMN05216506_11152 [Saccharopolyspora kobensis]
MTPLMASQDATPAAGAGVVVSALPAWDVPAPGGVWPSAVHSLSDEELTSRIGEVEQQIRQARMQQLRLIAEAHRRRLHTACGARSTQVWLKTLPNEERESTDDEPAHHPDSNHPHLRSPPAGDRPTHHSTCSGPGHPHSAIRRPQTEVVPYRVIPVTSSQTGLRPGCGPADPEEAATRPG